MHRGADIVGAADRRARVGPGVGPERPPSPRRRTPTRGGSSRGSWRATRSSRRTTRRPGQFLDPDDAAELERPDRRRSSTSPTSASTRWGRPRSSLTVSGAGIGSISAAGVFTPAPPGHREPPVHPAPARRAMAHRVAATGSADRPGRVPLSYRPRPLYFFDTRGELPDPGPALLRAGGAGPRQLAGRASSRPGRATNSRNAVLPETRRRRRRAAASTFARASPTSRSPGRRSSTPPASASWRRRSRRPSTPRLPISASRSPTAGRRCASPTWAGPTFSTQRLRRLRRSGTAGQRRLLPARRAHGEPERQQLTGPLNRGLYSLNVDRGDRGRAQRRASPWRRRPGPAGRRHRGHRVRRTGAARGGARRARPGRRASRRCGSARAPDLPHTGPGSGRRRRSRDRSRRGPAAAPSLRPAQSRGLRASRWSSGAAAGSRCGSASIVRSAGQVRSTRCSRSAPDNVRITDAAWTATSSCSRSAASVTDGTGATFETNADGSFLRRTRSGSCSTRPTASPARTARSPGCRSTTPCGCRTGAAGGWPATPRRRPTVTNPCTWSDRVARRAAVERLCTGTICDRVPVHRARRRRLFGPPARQADAVLGRPAGPAAAAAVRGLRAGRAGAVPGVPVPGRARGSRCATVPGLDGTAGRVGVAARPPTTARLRRALIAYKERGRRELAGPLGELLGRERAGPAGRARAVGRGVVLVPVPSARAAAAARGGDHLARLARRAAVASGVRWPAPLCARPARCSTRPGWGSRRRARNLRGALRARAPDGRYGPRRRRHRHDGRDPGEAGRALAAAGWPVCGAAVIRADAAACPSGSIGRAHVTGLAWATTLTSR